MTKISIIIPVYNAEKYLHRCLDSVCGQTLQDIEIICVNDASTDGSLEILHEYARTYSKLKIINHEANGGESKARNTGLEHATGEYIGFVDNDDEIDLDFYEQLYAKAKKENADIAKGEAMDINKLGQKSNRKLNDIILEYKTRFCFIHSWWTAIYKREMLLKHNIFLPQTEICGDIVFLHNAISVANKLEVLNDTFYYHYLRNDSSSGSQFTIEKITSALSSYKLITRSINRNIKHIPKSGYEYIMKHYFWMCLAIAKKNPSLYSLRLSVECMLSIYSNSHYNSVLDESLEGRNSGLPLYFKKNDIRNIISYFQNNNSTSKILTSKLRQRLIKNNVRMS